MEEPEDIVFPKRRWPWVVLLLLVLTLGAIGGFIAYVRAAHLATFRVDGARGCPVRIVYGPNAAPRVANDTLPWERSMDVRGADTLMLYLTLDPSCARTASHCSIDLDGRIRTRGGDACAEWGGRVWAGLLR
jgi:hypothetical protein